MTGRYPAILALILWLPAACAPVPVGRGEPAGPPRLTETAYTAADGAVLPVRQWPAESPHAIVLALHGFNDYRRAFALAAPDLAARGISVIAYDQRGFGETATAGRWAGEAALIEDALGLLRLLERRYPDTPVYLLGHSMGAAVATGVAARAEAAELVEATILAAPAAWGWSELNVFYRAVLWTLARLAPGWTPSGEGLDRIASDNREALIALGRDPLVIKETRVDSIYGLVGLMEHALEAAPRVTTPVLALFGEKDEIVPAHAIEALISRLPGKHTEVCAFPEGWHLLLRDLGRSQVIGTIANFIADGAKGVSCGDDEAAAAQKGTSSSRSSPPPPGAPEEDGPV